ncbi:MAG TPA: Hsp20/alpha crystallin family protein, partial [Armatimonadota bacterium]|nr:Hsp20/alpha crystallin family protein [Armatimonadota bacterium]
MALVRWKNSGDLMPWSAFSDLQGELNRLMEDFTYDWNALGRNWRPPMDLVETQDAYVLEADVPGVSSDDLHIETLDNTITIRGKREYKRNETDRNVHRMENR